MKIEASIPHKVPTTGKELIEEYKKTQKEVHTTMLDVVDIHNETVREGQKRRKAFYEMKDLKKKADKVKERRKEIVDEDMEIKRQRQKLLAERRFERESKWRRMTEKPT